MIFRKKNKNLNEFGHILGVRVCVARYNDRKNQKEAELGYIIARNFISRSNPYEKGNMHWKYLVKFSDGSTGEYKEDEIYLNYDRMLEDE